MSLVTVNHKNKGAWNPKPLDFIGDRERIRTAYRLGASKEQLKTLKGRRF